MAAAAAAGPLNRCGAELAPGMAGRGAACPVGRGTCRLLGRAGRCGRFEDRAGRCGRFEGRETCRLLRPAARCGRFEGHGGEAGCAGVLGRGPD